MECRTDAEDHNSAPEADAVGDSAYIWEKRHDVLYRCALSSRYHRRRERFFDLLDRATNAAALIGGSAAFAAAADTSLVKVAGAAVACTGALALVFSFADKARRHASLAEDYKRVESEIMRCGDFDYTETQVNAWRSRIAEIESVEPPTLRTMVSLCQNDIALAANQPEKVIPQPFIKRVLAPFFDIEPAR